MIVKMELEDNRVREAGSINSSANPRDQEFALEKGKRTPWGFIDGLRDVEVREIETTEGYIPQNSLVEFHMNVFSDCSPKDRVLITAKRWVQERGEYVDVAIVCDYSAYLLNDNGKTIERLN